MLSSVKSVHQVVLLKIGMLHIAIASISRDDGKHSFTQDSRWCSNVLIFSDNPLGHLCNIVFYHCKCVYQFDMFPIALHRWHICGYFLLAHMVPITRPHTAVDHDLYLSYTL